MRYNDPKLIDLLAAEYVSGTLIGKARLRFEGLMKYRADVRLRVAFWEQAAADIALNTPLQIPPKSLWRSIDARIKNTPPTTKGSTSWLWPTWSGIATATTAALLIVVINQSQLADPPVPSTTEPQFAERQSSLALNVNHVGLVGEQQAPLWVISANLETGTLSARAINAKAAELDRAFELWMLPNQGQPQSIGLLPVNGEAVTHTLPLGLMSLLKESKGLAVSVEPPGGSPTGLPTGEVIQTAKMWEL